MRIGVRAGPFWVSTGGRRGKSSWWALPFAPLALVLLGYALATNWVLDLIVGAFVGLMLLGAVATWQEKHPKAGPVQPPAAPESPAKYSDRR